MRFLRPAGSWLVAVIILVTVIVVSNLHYLLIRVPLYADLYEHFPFWVPESGKSALQIAIILAVLSWLKPPGSSLARELGLMQPAGAGLAFSFVASLPLLVGLGATGALDTGFVAADAAYMAGFGNVAEEVMYTGFALRQLYRRAGWSFWAAAVTVALVFGIGHTDKAISLSDAAGMMVLPAVGFLIFSWLFMRWCDNLWVPFGLHCFIDLWADLFVPGSVGLVGLLLASMLLAIGLTLWINPRKRPRLCRPDEPQGRRDASEPV